MYRLRLMLLLSLCFFVGFARPSSAQVPVKLFLQLEGIAGPSTDPQHQGWIELQGYGQGLTAPSGATPTFQGLKVLKRVDMTSPKLFDRATNGTVLTTVKVDVVRASDGAKLFTITLTDALVTSVSSTSEPSDLPQELVTFSFGSISLTLPDGTSSGWDLTQNKKL